MIKKAVVLFLCVCVVFSLAGCGRDEIEKLYSQSSEQSTPKSENKTSDNVPENEQLEQDGSSADVSDSSKTSPQSGKITRSAVASSKSGKSVSTAKTSSAFSKAVSASSTPFLPKTPAVSNNTLKPLSADQYYGWQILKKSGTAAEQKVYQALVSKIGSYSGIIEFEFAVTRNEVERAYSLYRDDYPQHFWRGNEYHVYSNNSGVVKVELQSMLFSGNTAKIKQLKQTVDSKANTVLSKLSGSMSEIERERIIHDEIIKMTLYDSSAKYCHNMAGVFAGSAAVCEGYAGAFQYLMRQAGIQCFTVRGSRGNESHIWNMVVIGGAYYHVDLTTDDPVMSDGSQTLRFDDFNVTQAEIKTSHTISGNAYVIPNATAEKYNFFKYYGLEFSSFTVDNFAKAIIFAIRNGYTYSYMKFNTVKSSNAQQFIQNGINYTAVMSKANAEISGKKVTGIEGISVNNIRNTLSLKLQF